MLTNMSTQRLRKLRDSSITVTKTEDRLVVNITPAWQRSKPSKFLRLPGLIKTGALLLPVLGFLTLTYAHGSGHKSDYIINLPWLIKILIFWPYYVSILPFKWLYNIVPNWFTHLLFGSISLLMMSVIWCSCLLYCPKSIQHLMQHL